MSEGWIKIHRDLSKWEWYADANTFRVFMDLLIHANYEDGRYQGYEVRRGQTVTGYPAIADRLKISVQSVRTSITRLKSTGSLTGSSTGRFTIYTIVNYDKYQCEDSDANRLINRVSNNPLTGFQQASNNIKEVKKERNKEKKDILVHEISDQQMQLPVVQKNGEGDLPVRRSEFENQFDKFWKVWRNKKNRRGAITKLKAAIKLEDFENILAAAEYFIRVECENTETKYIPHAATWLHNRRWEECLADPENPDGGEETREEIAQLSHSEKMARLGFVDHIPARRGTYDP